MKNKGVFPIFTNFFAEKQQTFQNRLNVLKVAHELNNSNLAILLGLKSGTSILNMEGGSLKPSVDVLLRLVSLFGVNIDWLYGRSDDIYCERDIESLEAILFELVVAPNTKFCEFGYLATRYCTDTEYRKVEFSLAERANIIFLLQYLKVVLEKNSTVMVSEEEYSTCWSLEAIKGMIAGRTKRMRFADAASERSYIMRGIYFILNNEFRCAYEDPSTLGDMKVWAKSQIKPLYDVEKVLRIQEMHESRN